MSRSVEEQLRRLAAVNLELAERSWLFYLSGEGEERGLATDLFDVLLDQVVQQDYQERIVLDPPPPAVCVGEYPLGTLLLWTVDRITSNAKGLDDKLLRVWQAYKPRLLASLVGLTSREEAADLLQETFVRVYQARPHQHPGDLPAQYLVRAAETTAIDYLRRQSAMRAATAEYVAWLKTCRTTKQADADRRLLLREVEDAAQHLRSKDQELLRLYADSRSYCGSGQAARRPHHDARLTLLRCHRAITPGDHALSA